MESIENPLFTLRLDEIQPSQVYVSQAKLNSVSYALQCGGPMLLAPVSVIKINDRWTLSDGHSRCLGLFLNGYSEVSVYEDEEICDVLMYKQCVKWCNEEALFSIPDLKDQIIPHPVFESFWLRRCRIMHKLMYQNLDYCIKGLSERKP